MGLILFRKILVRNPTLKIWMSVHIAIPWLSCINLYKSSVTALNTFHFHYEPTLYIDTFFFFFSHRKVKTLQTLHYKVSNSIYSNFFLNP